MTLSDLLTVIAGNTSLNVKLINSVGDEIITFNAPGYAAVESDLGARSVINARVKSSTEIVVQIGEGI